MGHSLSFRLFSRIVYEFLWKLVERLYYVYGMYIDVCACFEEWCIWTWRSCRKYSYSTTIILLNVLVHYVRTYVHNNVSTFYITIIIRYVRTHMIWNYLRMVRMWKHVQLVQMNEYHCISLALVSTWSNIITDLLNKRR